MLVWGLCCLNLTVAAVQPLEQPYASALAALEAGKTDVAMRELKLSLQLNPLHAESHFLLAALLGREGQIDQAMVGYKRVMTLEPNNAVARYNLGTSLLVRGEPVQAARLLNRVTGS